ncbi:hypothetical protein SNEBB_006177 [Seison nebaliae]|nr:hypothetical protein SNEBB_006177 [Seison nebaliae]
MLRCHWNKLIKNVIHINVRCASSTIDRLVKPSTSFVENSFVGRLVVKDVVPFPQSINEEESENLTMMVDQVAKFMENTNDADKNDDTSKLDEEVNESLKELGAFGLIIPSEYEGLGLTNTQYARLCQIIGKHDLGLGIYIGAHQSIGLKGIILFGNEEQKRKYLPDLAAGKKIAAYCLTEPTSGSDAASIQCKAKKDKDGNYRLNGNKIWISNGGIADIFTVFARTDMGDGRKNHLSAFIVERKFGNITSGPPESKMGIKVSNTTTLNFDDTIVPKENLLGREGEGFKIAMQILNNGRFGMAATLSGTMLECINKSILFAKERKQFGSSISSYGDIQEKLTRMAAYQYATESMAFTLSSNMDKGVEKFQMEAAISKIFGSEAAWYVCDESIQIHGGMGFMRSTGLERVLRDLRIFRIFEGSNDILRLFVSLSGMQFASIHLKDLQSKFKSFDTTTIMNESKKRLYQSIGLSSSSMEGSDELLEQLPNELHMCGKQLIQSIAAHGQCVENLLIQHKKNIIHQQIQLRRVANNTIDLFAMITSLSRASQSYNLNLSSAEHEMLLANYWCDEANRRIKNNVTEIQQMKNEKIIQQISNELMENERMFASHPLRL